MRSCVTVKQLKVDLQNLGIEAGDTVFIAADLLRVGYFNESREKTLTDWVNLLIDIVGSDGTLVIPAYTRAFLRFKPDRSIVFTPNSPTTSGALSAAFAKNSNCMRSQHPTNSCFAIGKNSKKILEGHNEKSSSYFPYGKVIELGGKNLMIGAFDEKKLAPMAMHYAQETLGVTKTNWAVGLFQTFFVDSEKTVKLYTRPDVGGCTAGGFKSYGYHIINQAIRFGHVGRGLSACVDCAKSHKIFIDLIKNNPDMVKCENVMCPCCYGSPAYMHPVFWLKKVYSRFVIRNNINRKSTVQ